MKPRFVVWRAQLRPSKVMVRTHSFDRDSEEIDAGMDMYNELKDQSRELVFR